MNIKNMEDLEDQHIRAFLDDKTNVDFNFESIEQLKAKREKFLLARTAPVENSEETPVYVPLPTVKKQQKNTVAEKRKKLQTSKSVSQCHVSNTSSYCLSSSWKSFSSLDFDSTGTIRTSRRLRDKKKKKDVKFGEVQVYYFKRNLGLDTVPSLEGVPLGMSDKHYLKKTYTFYEYSKAAVKQNEQKWSIIRKTIEEQKKSSSPRRSPRRGKGILLNGNFPSSVSKTALINKDSEDSFDENKQIISDFIEELLNVVVENSEKQKLVKEKEQQQQEEDMSDSDDEVYSSEIESGEEIPFIEPEVFQPLNKTIRHAILTNADVLIDPEFEDDESKIIRESRTKVGCSCKDGICIPDKCECSLNSIKCQVDYDEFPCGCSSDSCLNPEGRVEFNPNRIRTHYLTTLKLIRDMEKVNYEPTNFAPRYIKFPDDDECPNTSTSYLSTPPPPVYQMQKVKYDNAIIDFCTEMNNNNNEIITTPEPKKKKYPTTPTYKRANFNFLKKSNNNDNDDYIIPTEISNTTPTLRRSPRLSPMKRPSMTSIIVVGNVEQDNFCPVSKKIRSLEASANDMATFSQTIEEDIFASEFQ